MPGIEAISGLVPIHLHLRKIDGRFLLRKLKSPLIDVDNKYNEFFPSFSFFNKEFKPGNRLIDFFPDHFSFHFCSPNLKKHIEKLDEITFRMSPNPSLTIVVSDTSCYDSMLKVLSKELTLVLSDTRELDKVPNTK